MSYEKRIKAFETTRKLLHISYMEHKTNIWVWSKINFIVGSQEPLLATVKSRKVAWFRHVTHLDSLSKTIFQGALEGGLHCGRQRKCWIDNIKERTSLPMPELLTAASCRKDWKRISAESSLMSPWWSNWSRDWTDLKCYMTYHVLSLGWNRLDSCDLDPEHDNPYFLHDDQSTNDVCSSIPILVINCQEVKL